MKFTPQEGSVKEFRVTTDENGFPALYLDGDQLPTKEIYGFAVKVRETRDPEVTIDMSSATRSASFTVSARKVTIDGYESVGRVKDLFPSPLSFGSKLKEATLDRPNWLACFISDRCIRDPGGAVGQMTLYRAYRKWAAGNVLYTLPEYDFYRAMADAGYQRKRADRKMYWKGLLLAHSDEVPTPPVSEDEKKRLLALLEGEPEIEIRRDHENARRAVNALFGKIGGIGKTAAKAFDAINPLTP